MKTILLLFFLSVIFITHAQPNFVVLRKHNQTIKTYFPTSYFVFQLSNKQWLEGRIKMIRDDSIFVNLMAIRQVANYFGLPTVDTVRLGLFKVHVNEIYALPKDDKHSGILANGVIFQAAGAGYIGLNIINGIGKSEPIFSAQNASNLSIAAGVFAIGTLLHKTYKDTYILGKKYRLYSSENIMVQ